MHSNFNMINIGKFLSALCVVAVHTFTIKPIEGIGTFFLINGIARIAVPFFFCATGYFLAKKGLQDSKIVFTYVKKIAKGYIYLSMVYIPIEVIKIIGMGEFNLKRILRYGHEIIVQGTFLHLWYFPAVIIGVLMLYYLMKKLPIYVIVMISCVLYFIGLLGDSYYGILDFFPRWMGEGMNIYNSIFITTRNGVFFGLPMIVLGVLIFTFSEKLENIKMIPWLIIFTVALGSEVLILKELNFSRDYNMLISIVPLTMIIFCMLLKSQYKPKRDTNVLKRQSEFLYRWHPLVLGGIIIFMDVDTFGIFDGGLVRFIAVVLITLLFGYKRLQFIK